MSLSLRGWTVYLLVAFLVTGSQAAPAHGDDRPNILWLTSEDNGPQLGAYGDAFATTPHLDALARRSMIYLHAWSNAPVCAPARTAIISGMYPSSTGAEHMRSNMRLPDGMVMFPRLLRDAGYYCTNNNKEDYNLEKTGRVWDESSRNAHWKNRAEGQPFFAVFNFNVTHESQIRKRPHRPVHDPAKVPLPAYHPDRPEVRQDWAQYYDKMTDMDGLVGARLAELAEAGLADDTIVFYFGDHGPGLPRSKRWPYNSGLHVPLIVHIPEKFRELASGEYTPGGRSDRLVSFVDLAPTVLSLAGVAPPSTLQGRAFLGPFAAEPRRFVFGARGRVDERCDLVRSVRDARYVYIRNFMPHRIYGQYLAYMFQGPTTQVWHQLFAENRLNDVQSRFWEPKPFEELYDLKNDPDEVRNLADSSEHQQIKQRLQAALRQWQLEIRDVGLLPEAEMHRRMDGRTAYELGHDSAAYPVERIVDMAYRASYRGGGAAEPLLEGLRDPDSGVRYWAATGLLIRGTLGQDVHAKLLSQRLDDVSPSVRIAAAEALVRFGAADERRQALEHLIELADQSRHGTYTALQALNAIDNCGEHARVVFPRVSQLPTESREVHARLKEYIPRLVERIESKQ